MLDRLISADCHVTEPMDLWKRRLPPSMRDRGPRLEVRGGRMGFMVEDHMAFKMPPLPGAKDLPEGPVESGAAGDDIASRSAALEKDGV